MSSLFRDAAPVLGPNAQVEVISGGTAPTSVGLQIFEAITVPLIATTTSQAVFTCPRDFSNGTAGSFAAGKYTLLGVAVRFGTASTSGTLQIEKTPSATAVGSGTNILSGTVSLAGTANTVVYGFPSASLAAASNILSNGDSLSIVIAGTMTNLALGVATIYVARLVNV